ncbi:hypothetical protein HZV21_004808 [Salmonella enterica]|nr:hypothetical protein [Salmonella enterica]EJK5561789.1 hypothetical protein [Salmonella enterica]
MKQPVSVNKFSLYVVETMRKRAWLLGYRWGSFWGKKWFSGAFWGKKERMKIAQVYTILKCNPL